MKKLYQNNNRAAKFLACGLMFLLWGSSIVYAQDKRVLVTDSLQLQNVIIRKNKNYNIERNRNNAEFYIAFNYDYGDSISVFVDNKNVYNGILKYLQVDTNSTLYPYNRLLLRFSKQNITSKCSKCQIFFWESRKVINFCLTGKIEFYILEILKNEPSWYLSLSNTYPWPD